VGGGSLVNGGMAVQPKKEYFKEILPELDADKFWSHYFPLAKKELCVNEIPEDYFKTSEYYMFSRVGEAEAHKAGFATMRVPNVYSFDYMQKEEKDLVPKSALKGEVIYGNNFGKKSLDQTYLQKALKTGLLSIYDLHKVTAITQSQNGSYVVKVDVIDTTGALQEQKIITCKRLFLNAGSMGTSKLLLAARHNGDLPRLNEWTGKLWGTNGNVMCGRNMVNTVFNKVQSDIPGVEFERGTNAKQSTIPISGIDNWDHKKHAFFAEISPLPMKLEVYTALYLLINKLPTLGSIEYDDLKKDIVVNWTKKNNASPLANAKYLVKKLNKANGGTKAGLLFKGGFGPGICYHPLGGMVLNKATDNFGRVHGYQNLYVTDGSLIPGTIGVNPFLTITAVAEYCIEHILKTDFET
jgi:cholesterol oxidase